mmetsp:Transcript_18164/g.32459  ORF Transcript_18164/g.32459 Transcript_18164/m.32459 type:complete len:472 (-) Transcript_18164:346-1761(-)|eukprot:CAMPEP_0196141880 /NCGR_PEP_ID=MMETSP0910-20130528/10687_1 /TAXON_ID=49265 /ORGANISM="Thalassiosira rotula, Strain GSO102" /LENGTH=471 /DNA_ID=CAMNT_0041403109 /DNA_START=50 /DNA_END=1465 /DNA_ORIENTATION=-
MIRNNQPLFHHHSLEEEDALTIQVSSTNSHLGQLLLEADWSEASDHLATPEGRRDVVDHVANNDPLGLFNNNNRQLQIPSSKNTAFFAGLFVRAPYVVIQQIYAMAPDQVKSHEDLSYILAVVPSEEEARLSHQQQQQRTGKVPHYRTRSWTAEEYEQILNLLLQSFFISSSKEYNIPSSSVLLDFSPPWIIEGRGIDNFQMTPLAIAAYNSNVSPTILRVLCSLEPRAMKKESKLFGGSGGGTIPLVLAAASPVPPKKSSSGYDDDARERRWEKVMLLTLSEEWYDEQRGMLLSPPKTPHDAVGHVSSSERTTTDIEHRAILTNNYATSLSPSPTPTLHQVKHACEESIHRNEWELVREFLKRFSPGGHHSVATMATTKQIIVDFDVESSILEPIRAALVKHDDDVRTVSQRKKHSGEKARAREEWMHKYLGPVMYNIDAMVDLASVVIPSSRKKHRDNGAGGGIVSPMS